MKTKRIMAGCVVVLIIAFSLFAVVYQRHLQTRAVVQIRDHANIIASSLWTFEKSSPTAYLTLAAQANGYDRIVVSNDKGESFLQIHGREPSVPDRLLRSAGLLPVHPLEAPIHFEGKRIGTISALWPCPAVYVDLYVLLCILLMLPGIWFFLRLLDSKRTLEGRVRKRTAELERENTERKRTEEALQESNRILQTIIETAPTAIIGLDLDGRVQLVWNRAAEKMLGWSAEEAMGRFLPSVPDERTEEFEQFRLWVRSGKSLDGIEVRREKRDGTPIDYSIYARPMYSAEGKITGNIAVMVELTERIRAEEALRKYERIVSVSQDLMALIRRDYVYEAVNESFLKAHLKTRDQVLGRPMPEVLGENVFREKIQRRMDQALGGQTVRYQEQLEFAGLGSRIVNVTYFPVFDAKGKVEGVVVNARDITDTRKLEEQLLQSQRIESIGTLAGGVAHEINNPINGIMNYAQLILDFLEEEHPGRKFAREILHETQRIAKIVRNLLTFARYEKQSHSTAQLSDIIASVLSLIQTVMRHDQISLEVIVPEDLPKIKCRSQQIQQVLMNLLTNARDSLNERYPGYSPDKKLRVVAGLITKEDRRFIRTTVEDTGMGIPVEIRERIFDPFFTTKPKETGTGLGLSISYGIVRDHGGELTVESEPSRYARFHMDLCVDNGWTLSKPENGREEPSPEGRPVEPTGEKT